MTTKVPFMSRVAPEVRRRAKEKARLEYRSLNNYIEFLVLKDLGTEIPVQTDEEIDISFE
jgi:predicted HicB family RNase H-like nuclease